MCRVRLVLVSLLLTLGVLSLSAQSDLAGISGVVLDSTGAVVPGASLILTSLATLAERQTTSGADGSYSFPNLRPGDYRLAVTAEGFRVLEQSGISLRPNQRSRLDPSLELGAVSETVTVEAVLNPINFENASQETGVGPDTLTQLPLLVRGGVRNAANFSALLPGVNFGATGREVYSGRVNGGMGAGDQVVLDGANMSGMGGNQGFYNAGDFQLSPDMISEFRLVASNYDPQFGASTSSQVVMKTRSGTAEYHGGLFAYHRNTVLNARQFGAPRRPKDIENDFGGFIGGPIPGLNRGNVKTFGYLLRESFRIRGQLNVPTLSIPSMKQRMGDFTDWTASNGSLIPVYDPATTRADGQGGLTRDPFNCMGVPNVICPSRIQNSLANQWLQHLPTPTSNGPINNYVPAAVAPIRDRDYMVYKVDFHPNLKDHISWMSWGTDIPANTATTLPPILSGAELNNSTNDVVRVNWDRTFSPTVINNFNLGVTTFNTRNLGLGAEFVDQLPKIAGVGEHANPPGITFEDGFQDLGDEHGPDNVHLTRNLNFNNLTTWVRGKHTFKFGAEYLSIKNTRIVQEHVAGTFRFGRSQTGLLGQNSGSPIASFLLEQVGTASAFFRTIDGFTSMNKGYIGHLGDTWKATSRLTLNIGVRWDMYIPIYDRDDNWSFFDPNIVNAAAGGRLGGIAFAGDDKGAASSGARYPERLFKKAFSPRFGLAYALDNNTVIRAGYGIFYSQPQYPGWQQGINQDGFNAFPAFSGGAGGLEPAMILSEGFPQNFNRPPFFEAGVNNGQGVFYRDFNGNKAPYAQQWNLTVERRLFGDTASLSVGYIANRGSRLPSGLHALNVLHLDQLSLGTKLREQFRPGQTSLQGVPVPYEGWAQQLGCAPSLAQALLPYPQFCSRLEAVTENAGQSTYHSMQVRLQKELSAGTYVLASYTLAKMLSTSGAHAQVNAGVSRAYSPFEQHRAKAVAPDDVPHNLTLSWVYELPFGRGGSISGGNSALRAIAGGWSVSGIFQVISGVPFWVRSNACNTPPEFRVQCVPALLNGANAYAQDKGSFDPGKGPLFNANAFEPLASFQQFGYYGAGSRLLPNVRLPGVKNWDLSVYKNTRLTEQLKLQLRFEFFNILNMHSFTRAESFAGAAGAFQANLASPAFGGWNGGVTSPRNIQLGARLEF